MASTFSPSLRLELIGDGDQSGIWGQTTNNNLGSLIEQAIAGAVTITMVDANYTLSNFNGVVDESRNQVITATGALSAQRNIIAPLVEKTYTIRNNTTGGFGVQIIGPSGTGVIVPNGATVLVYCDGTNFLRSLTASAGNFSVNGNFNVTGTTTLTGALGASTATFSGAISSVSPTFTGTPTAPTATAGTNTTQIATTAFVQNVAGSLGTMSTQNANAVAITGGAINGTTIGAVTAATVRGTTGTFTGALSATTGTFSGAVAGTTGTFSGAVSGLSFSGAGTGLTGTAASLSIGGNAATATNSTNATNLTGSGTISATTTATTQAVSTDNTTVATTAFVRDIIPSGVILMWSGSIASIPAGWLLCNGTSGTPNLQDRFIVGAGSAYAVGATGGSANAIVVSHTHTFSATTDTGGAHSHTTPKNGVAVNSCGGTDVLAGNFGSVCRDGDFNIPTANSAHAHTLSGTTASTGSSATNANLPPYYALAYIMKS